MKLFVVIACSLALGSVAAAKTAEWMNAATAVVAGATDQSSRS